MTGEQGGPVRAFGVERVKMTDRLLAIDIGNTNIALGVFDGEDLLAKWRLETRLGRTEDEMSIVVSQLFGFAGVEMGSVGGVAISCVAPPALFSVIGFARRMFSLEPLVVGPGVRTGVTINTDSPREVGADRIVNAAGALARHEPPLILVDFGTAVTIDAVSAKSEYLGGAITPGVRLSMDALYHHAAKLSEVELARPPSVIGKNTAHSIQAGAYFGFAAMVDGIVSRMKPLLSPEPRVIATGGEARLITPASSTVDIVEDDLTLEGLRVIYNKNRQ